MNGDEQNAARRLLDPDEVEGVLSGSFYTPAPTPPVKAAKPAEKPVHYKVICISIYTSDLERLDEATASPEDFIDLAETSPFRPETTDGECAA